MPNDCTDRNRHATGVMTRLLRDKRGNTLAIAAAMIVPLAGMVGGGLDMSRQYIAKTRLQHACDAGALAGRKAMGAGIWTQSSGMPEKTALQFFDGNFESGSYGSNTLTRTFTEKAGKVAGTASVRMPMTLMKIFGKPTAVLSVSCDAEMRLPNTDVMFVLDVTGSMSSPAVTTDKQSKIDALKESVKCFYEIVARLDTKANCSTGAPSGGTGNQVQIRFGFMPYATNVNVGRLLPTSYFANSWTYQSRRARWWNVSSTSTPSQKPESFTNVSSAECTQAAADALATSQDSYSGENKYTTKVTYRRTGWASSTSHKGTCSGTSTTVTTTYAKTFVVSDAFADWQYAAVTHNLAGLKNGTAWNSAVRLRLGANGAEVPINWDGCIEERRPTVQQASYSPIPTAAHDLNINLVPSQGTATSLWGPALPQAVFYRRIKKVSPTPWNDGNRDETFTTDDYRSAADGHYYCPTEARKLDTWPSATLFENYVDSLRADGNTYHDIGMLWGARFLSPTGIFAADNATTPQGGEIMRHMIFMTDGDAVSQPCDYAAYGIAWWDRRTTTDVGTNSTCNGYGVNGVGTGYAALNNQVNARLDALCMAVRNMNITLWVISFGDGSNAATERRLEACASPDRYFTARNSAALQQTFKGIADQISQLRLTS